MRKEKVLKLKVIKQNRNWVCSFCGSKDIIEKAWVSLNHDISVDDECYVKYINCADEIYWCDYCNDEASPIPSEDYKEKEDE